MSDYLEGFDELPKIPRERFLHGNYLNESVEYSKEDWSRDMAYFRSRGFDTTKQMMDAYMQPAIEQTERIRTKYCSMLNEAFMGERAFSDGLTLYASPLLYDYYSQNGIPAPFTYLVKNEPLPKMGSFIPQLYTEAATRSLISDMQKTPAWIAWSARIMQRRRANKRKCRQHRAAFRRRKRGLA